MFQLKSLSVSALFQPLKASLCWYTHKQKNVHMHFFILELHKHASDFSGSVKRQTLPPYLILIYTLLWLCAEYCTLVTTNARLSTFWQLTKWTISVSVKRAQLLCNSTLYGSMFFNITTLTGIQERTVRKNRSNKNSKAKIKDCDLWFKAMPYQYILHLHEFHFVDWCNMLVKLQFTTHDYAKINGFLIVGDCPCRQYTASDIRMTIITTLLDFVSLWNTDV